MQRTPRVTLGVLSMGLLALTLLWWRTGPDPAPAGGEAGGAAVAATDRTAGARPNVLWVVWDTARSDRMGLYGAARATTPRLDAWAKDALVFTEARSVAHSTLPAHAAMFTGLHAMQHGAHYGHPRLDERLDTIAELFARAGYRTFMWSSNPHVSAATHFDQGFQVTAHPWDARFRARALEIVAGKVTPDEGTGMGAVMRAGDPNEWAIKAAGELSIPALLDFLDGDPDAGADRPRARSDAAPYFAFINLMEAHRQYVPPRRLRERFLTTEQVARSYAMDNSWPSVWGYTFGLQEYPAADLEVVAGVYDACLAELDGIFADLLDALRARGALENTVVVLTADHGEHLGERHMLDHQYTVYEPVLRVPLVIHFPGRVEAGRSAAPVMNFDVFPTLLELAGITPKKRPSAQPSFAVSLLHPPARRARLAELPVAHRPPVQLVRQRHPDWEPGRWLQPMCALYEGNDKLVWRQGSAPELYDLANDPGEARDLADQRRARAEALRAALLGQLDATRAPAAAAEAVPAMTEAQQERLRALGYAR